MSEDEINDSEYLTKGSPGNMADSLPESVQPETSDRLPVAIFYLDQAGCFVWANRVCLSLFHNPESTNLTGMKIIDFCTDRHSRAKFNEYLLSHSEINDFEISIRPEGIGPRWVILNLRRHSYDGGEGHFWAGSAVDITDRRLIEQNLHQWDKFTRTVIEKSPVGVSVRSPTGRLLAYNDAWRKIWGISDERLNDYLMRDRSELKFDRRDSYLDDWIPVVKAVYERGGHLHIPNIRLPQSTHREALWVSQHFYAIEDESGKVERVVILTENITHRKLAEDDLRKSQARYRALVENAPISIITLSVDGMITSCNKAYLTMTGYSREDVIGKHFTQLGIIKSEDAPQYARLFREIISGRHKEPYEVECLCRDGRQIVLEANITLLREDNRLAGVQVIARDITSYREAAEAVRKSEERYRTLQANLPVGVFRSTADGKILSVNPAIAKMYGYSDQSELLNTPAEKLYCRADGRREIIERLKREGSITEYESLMRRKDGSTFWISQSATATFDDEGNIIHIDGVEQDISERKLATARLAAVNREKYEQAKRIAGVFAHEIRNALFPAAAALNRLVTKSLENSVDDKVFKKYVAIAERAIASAADTTKLISAYTKLDTEAMPEKVDLAAVIRDIINNHRMRIEETEVQIEIDGPEDVFVTSNRRQLLLALSNVFLNSLQTLENSGNAMISVKWNQNDSHVNLKIKDNGKGIAAENLNNIFELFFTTRPTEDGNGIGLAAARKIIEMYGGSISASSELGRWTCFDIELLIPATASAK